MAHTWSDGDVITAELLNNLEQKATEPGPKGDTGAQGPKGDAVHKGPRGTQVLKAHKANKDLKEILDLKVIQVHRVRLEKMQKINSLLNKSVHC